MSFKFFLWGIVSFVSVFSQDVGFHIYHLRSFECHNFKIYFYLWHGGGPNFWHEYTHWLDEQSSEWVEVVKKQSKPTNLSGANLVQLGTRRVLRPRIQNQNAINQARQLVFKRIKPALTPAFNPALKGILGPHNAAFEPAELLSRPSNGPHP